jgi:hypothetical protein
MDVPGGAAPTGSSVPVGGPLGEMIVNAPDASGGSREGPTRAVVTLNVRAVRSPEGFVASLIVAVLAKPPVPQPVELTAEWTTLPDDPSAPTTLPAGYAVEIEPADDPPARDVRMPRTGTVRANTWPDYRDEVEASLHVTELTYSPADGTVTGTLECRRPTIALAYDLTLHLHGGHPREAPCGFANFAKGVNGSVTFSTRIPNLNAGEADLILEHSDRTATSRLPPDETQVWAHPVVLRNVPIRRASE